MKRPTEITLHEIVLKKKDHIWIDHNGKQKYKYYIEIPFWIGRAYNLDHKRVQVKIGFKQTMGQYKADRKVVWDYFKANWSTKVNKMRKMNSGYILVSTERVGTAFFKSIDDYNTYHVELKALNKKYKRRDTESPDRGNGDSEEKGKVD